MKIWVPKNVMVQQIKSARLRAWADTKHKYWVSGKRQGKLRMEKNGEVYYGVHFLPNRRYGDVYCWCPASAINVDVSLCQSPIRGG